MAAQDPSTKFFNGNFANKYSKVTESPGISDLFGGSTAGTAKAE